MSQSDVDELFEEAMGRVNAGELSQGRALLEKTLEQDPHNDQAWVWLSGCVEDPRQRRICLEQALNVNPHNQAALDGMKVLDGQLVQVTSAEPTLLERRLTAIGMGEGEADAGVQDADAALLESPPAPVSDDVADLPEVSDSPEEPRARRPLTLVLALVLILAVLACGLAVAVGAILPVLGIEIVPGLEIF
jgi:hypothetical protein